MSRVPLEIDCLIDAREVQFQGVEDDTPNGRLVMAIIARSDFVVYGERNK